MAYKQIWQSAWFLHLCLRFLKFWHQNSESLFYDENEDFDLLGMRLLEDLCNKTIQVKDQALQDVNKPYQRLLESH